MDDALKTKLTELGLTEEQVGKLETEGAKTEADLQLLSGDDIKSMTECGLVVAKKVAAAFAPEPEAAPMGSISPETLGMVLPTLPTDESWLTALRTGGVRKVEQSTVIAALRSALAFQVGLYDVPEILKKGMEDFAERTEEQVDPKYYEMRRMVTRVEYGDIFQDLPGMDGTYVTKGRKDEMLRRINDDLWPAIISFNNALSGWMDTWTVGANNPGMIMAAVLGRGAGGIVPPVGMQVPPTDGLRDEASAVNDAINRIFRGDGVQITSALAVEAKKIKETLQDSSLPALVGEPSRELMLRALKIGVPATYPRLENNLTQFVLGIMGVEDQPSGDAETQYFSALYTLGSQIDFDQLNSISSPSKKAGLGGGRATSGRRPVSDHRVT